MLGRLVPIAVAWALPSAGADAPGLFSGGEPAAMADRWFWGFVATTIVGIACIAGLAVNRARKVSALAKSLAEINASLESRVSERTAQLERSARYAGEMASRLDHDHCHR